MTWIGNMDRKKSDTEIDEHESLLGEEIKTDTKTASFEPVRGETGKQGFRNGGQEPASGLELTSEEKAKRHEDLKSQLGSETTERVLQAQVSRELSELKVMKVSDVVSGMKKLVSALIDQTKSLPLSQERSRKLLLLKRLSRELARTVKSLEEAE